jgi:hypothetical protein
MKKIPFLVFIIFTLLSSLLVSVSAASEPTPKPSVPDFSLKIVENPYDVPPIKPQIRTQEILK